LDKRFPGANFREQLALARLQKSHNIDINKDWVGASSDIDVSPPFMVPTAKTINLDINQAGSSNPTISEEDYESLRQLSNATDLRIQGKRLPKEGLSFLTDFKNLERLGIYDARAIVIHDEDLAYVAQLPKLKTLELHCNELTNDGFRHLSA